MIIALLLVMFAAAFVVATVVMLLFRRPIEKILQRLLRDDVSEAWARYLMFAIYVVGIGGGVQVWSIERYLDPVGPTRGVTDLTQERWVLEIYKTVMGTLQSTAWLLLVFFVFALIAMVIVKGLEARRAKPAASEE